LLAAPFPDGWRRGYILPPLQGLGTVAEECRVVRLWGEGPREGLFRGTGILACVSVLRYVAAYRRVERA